MTAPSTSAPPPAADNHPWSAYARKLRAWLRVYLAVCGLWFVMTFLPSTVFLAYLGQFVSVASLVLFIGCLVYAYRVQAKLNAARFARTGAWAIVFGGFFSGGIVDFLGYTNGGWILFYALGFTISMSVLHTADKVDRRLRAEANAPSPLGPTKDREAPRDTPAGA